MLRKTIFGRQKAIYNTFIGGVGSAVVTKSDLATFLGVSESIISYFNNDGTNIKAFITTNYGLGVNAVNAQPLLTYFIDVDGKQITKGLEGSWINNVNLKQLYLPKIGGVGHATGFSEFSGNCWSK